MPRSIRAIALAVALVLAPGCDKNNQDAGELDDKDYGGMFQDGGMFADISAAPRHDTTPPARFSASWIGREAALVLRRAVARQYDIVSSAPANVPGVRCTMFHDDGVVRRLVALERRASHEFAMNERGETILWYRATREKPPQTEGWGYFHHGRMRLFQVREDRGERRTEAPPRGLGREVLSLVSDCIGAAGSSLSSRPESVDVKPLVPKSQDGGRPISGKRYEILASHSDLCLEVKEGKKKKGTRLVQNHCTDKPHQHFRVWEDDGAFRITVDHTGFCVDVAGANKNNRAAIAQVPCNGGDHQRFNISKGSGNDLRITAVHSSKGLDVSGASQSPGAIVHQYHYGGGANQRFKLRRVDE